MAKTDSLSDSIEIDPKDEKLRVQATGTWLAEACLHFQAEHVVQLPAFYTQDTPASANEMWQKLHGDPMFAVSSLPGPEFPQRSLISTGISLSWQSDEDCYHSQLCCLNGLQDQ